VALILTPFAAAAEITSTGPLTRVLITPDLNCGVSHVGDSAPEFFGDTACGTLLASGGVLYGPASIPAGGGASPRTAFTPVSQTGPTGTGTAGDPYRIVTVVDLGTSGLRITETDSYVLGQESYRTDVQVSNTGGASRDVILYRAGDCFLQNSDFGFGAVETGTGAVTCLEAINSTTPGTRIEQFFPITPGSKYYEAQFNEVWSWIGTQVAFPNTCRCGEYIDNGAGLSWSITIPPGGSTTVSSLITFSPLGIAPLSTTKTADAATSAPASGNGYTITVANPNASAVTLNSITDTLPAGFSYVSGSTTGVTTANPSVSGQTLTWAGPFSVPATGSVSLHFSVIVSSTPGDYFNNATADAGSATVVPTGPTAMITVTSPQTGTLQVIKHVVNDSGGSASAANFTLSVSGTSPSSASFPGAESPGTTVTLGPGSYSVTETGPSGYTASFSADCSGTIAAGQTKTCTITNDDIAAPPVGDEGCSHGYWKNHESAWISTAYSPSQTVGSVFSAAGPLGSSSLLDALKFKGGSTITAAKQILLRQAVAALLNAAHPGVAYPRTTAQVIASVNAALASNDRTTILELASALDADNNLGCPLS